MSVDGDEMPACAMGNDAAEPYASAAGRAAEFRFARGAANTASTIRASPLRTASSNAFEETPPS